MTTFLFKETQGIVNAHKGDFDCTTYEAYLKKQGGYQDYLNRLGGVFGKYAGFTGTATTVRQFHEITDYVFGLFSIFGFDYNNGNTYVRYPDRPFYVNGQRGRANAGRIDDLCRLSAKAKTTCCNWAIDSLLYKLGWLPRNGQEMSTQARFGALVTKKSDLQIGDIVHFYRDPNKVFKASDPATYGKSGWHHVVIVVQVTPTSIVVADGGSRMQKNGGTWLYTVSKSEAGFGGTYGASDKWLARRIFTLNNPTTEGKTDTDLALECILGRDINGATWGNDPVRSQLLGDRYEAVQARINELCKDTPALVHALVDYTIEGKAGNGTVRTEYLGEFAPGVQSYINAIDKDFDEFIGKQDDWSETYLKYAKVLFRG